MLKVPLHFKLEYFPHVVLNRRASFPAVTHEKNSAWNVGSLALVDLALMEAREDMSESGMVSRQLERFSSNKNNAVSLLTSALEVSSIQDGGNDASFSSPKSSVES
jgi:hypothetical protein